MCLSSEHRTSRPLDMKTTEALYSLQLFPVKACSVPPLTSSPSFLLPLIFLPFSLFTPPFSIIWPWTPAGGILKFKYSVSRILNCLIQVNSLFFFFVFLYKKLRNRLIELDLHLIIDLTSIFVGV